MAESQAAPKRVVAKLEAELKPGPDDEILTSAELARFELFGKLRKGVSVERFPGSLILRRFRAGAPICLQRERGHSAFYICRTEDVVKLREAQLQQENANVESLQAEADRLRLRLEEQPKDANGQRLAAKAHIVGGAATAKPRGLLRRMKDAMFGRKPAPVSRPENIPNDGPSDVDYETRQAPMFEGDVFGEMSCMTLAPRSATVIAETDCYMIEFLRNIFDQLQRDDGYRELMDRIYEERVLEGHLRRLEFFQNLSDSQMATLREGIRLEVMDAGDVICDEGESADDVYIIRSGMVQVLKGVNVAVAEDHFDDWQGFCKELIAASQKEPPAKKESAAKPTGAAALLAQMKAKQTAKKEPEPTQPGETRPAPKGSVEDILAQARGGAKKGDGGADKAKDKPEATSKEKEKPSVDDILAQARGGANKGDGGADEAKDKPEAASKEKEKPSVDDILAQARGGANKGDGGASEKAKDKPQATSKEKPSAEDILAQARGGAKAKTAAAQSRKIPAQPEEVDVKDAPPLQAKAPAAAGHPDKAVWQWFTKPIQETVKRIADDQAESGDRGAVAAALNELMRRRDFVGSKDLTDVLKADEVRDTVLSFPKGAAGVKKDWTPIEVRVAARLALQQIFPNTFPKRKSSGPPKILDYMSRGDCFGEMAMILKQPRQATCVAYDHPAGDPNRTPGRVELVRIRAESFQKILDETSELRGVVDELVRKRQENIRRAEQEKSWESRNSLITSPEFRDEGLIQGQKLLLIDLDRCTRCGDCVRACVDTHDDGYTRLFLDGPRFDKYLVPSACRQCLNPACMIGCPVGSIQRGDNGQIEIKDWCIGCRVCEKQCPYDSIQMHDIGLVPSNAFGWQYLPASAVRGNWQASAGDGDWSFGAGPIHWTLDVQSELAGRGGELWSQSPNALPEAICLRLGFNVSSRQLSEHSQYRLFIYSGRDLQVQCWLNGKELEIGSGERKKGAKPEFEAQVSKKQLRVGRNVVAVTVGPPGEGEPPELAYDSELLLLRIDPISEAGEVTLEAAGESYAPEVQLVTEKAVVCDLCSGLASRQPACVDMCPHDAAIRVDARFEFPLGQ